MDEYPNEGLSLLLHMMTEWNVFLMRRLNVPPLYRAGVRYIREDYESIYPEDWLDCIEIMSQGGGDCEDLACYRAAELRVRGERARTAFHRKRMPDGGQLVHIFVERANGALEDPSRLLGMEG